MAQERAKEPSGSAGRAALAAGWSHRHRDVSGGWLRPTVFGGTAGGADARRRSGLRQLAFGALAIAVTYLVGRMIGSQA